MNGPSKGVRVACVVVFLIGFAATGVGRSVSSAAVQVVGLVVAVLAGLILLALLAFSGGSGPSTSPGKSQPPEE